jgi:hypothetical protein
MRPDYRHSRYERRLDAAATGPPDRCEPIVDCSLLPVHPVAAKAAAGLDDEATLLVPPHQQRQPLLR